MFSWTRGQQIVAIGATAAIVAAGGYVGLRRMRAVTRPAQDEFFTEPVDETDVGRIMVHVSGAVMRPGAYYVAADARVQDAIWSAGGPAPNADLDAVNLAAFLADGDKVTVPAQRKPGAPGQSAAPTASSKVNINTATARELEQLPGIGPKIAADIVEYRERHGTFTRLEQLEDVPGIGDKKLEDIKPHISL